MNKVGYFFKSLRFRIFLLIAIIGIAAVFVFRAMYLGFCRDEAGLAESALRELGRSSLVIALILSAAIIVAAVLVSILMTRPLKRLNHSINAVQDGLEDQFTPVTNYSETKSVSDACAAMLTRLQILDRTQQEFVSNVSHELKTPLTSMKVLADSLVEQEDVPEELYREFMEDIGNEMLRENEIIDDLLSLVRTDKTSAKLNLAPVQIDEMLEAIRKQMAVIAQSTGVQLLLDIKRPVAAEVDEVKISLAITNLIENAVKYNHPGGWVRVTLDTEHQNCLIIVEDNGIGIPAEAQEEIFERFYRADKSHSSEIEGTGLGLSLARNVVLLHRGSIKVDSEPEVGSVFTVRFPLLHAHG